MTDNQLADSHLDAAIDRAVRELMTVEPRADLQRRVMAEITHAPARAALWPRLAFGSAALALAVVVLFMFARRPAERDVEQIIVQAPAAAPGRPTTPAAGPPPNDATRGPDIAPKPRTGAVARRPAGQDRLIQAASIDTADLTPFEPMAPIELLMPVDPIGTTTLDPLGISIPELSIKPLTIQRIEIVPLTPRR
jgi:hypothetical protein